MRIVLKKHADNKKKASEEIDKACGHRPSELDTAVGCCACYVKRLRAKYYGPDEGRSTTGGNQMAKKVMVKKAKVVKEDKAPRVTAAGILLEQFGLKTVKGNEELVELIREKTGSTKFNDTQLAWYKSQYRAGKMKGQNGKPGHLIAQAGGHMKESAKAKAPAKKVVAVKAVAKKKAVVEEPIED